MISIRRKGEIGAEELYDFDNDDGYLDNCAWVIYRHDLDNGKEFPFPAMILTDYESVKEWVKKNPSVYGRVERWELGKDHSQDNWDDPSNSHQHFGIDTDAEIVLCDFGSCQDCEEELGDEYDDATVLLHEEQEVDGHQCILEWYRCGRCNREYGAFGVEGVNLVQFQKSTPDEELDFKELHDLAISQLDQDGDEE